MKNARGFKRVMLSADIAMVRSLLSNIEPSDRLQVIAEALMDLREGEIEYQSCGCFEWDITMDYRNAEERK